MIQKIRYILLFSYRVSNTVAVVAFLPVDRFFSGSSTTVELTAERIKKQVERILTEAN